MQSGIIYEGEFFAEGSAEYKELLLIEGTKPENAGTLLHAVATMEIEDNNVFDLN